MLMTYDADIPPKKTDCGMIYGKEITRTKTTKGFELVECYNKYIECCFVIPNEREES